MSTLLRSSIVNLIYAVTHTLGDAAYETVGDDEHYRCLVSKQVDAIFEIADAIGFDLWAATTCPSGRTENIPLAILLREADARHGIPGRCAPHVV